MMDVPTIPNHLREHHLLLSIPSAVTATAAAAAGANHTVHLVWALLLKLPESPSVGQSALILNLSSDLSPARVDSNVTAVPTPALILTATKRPSVTEVPGNPAGCLVAEPDAHLRVPWVWAWRARRIRVAVVAVALEHPTLELLSQSSDSSIVTVSLTSSLETLDDSGNSIGITTPSKATGASQSLPCLLCLSYPCLATIAECSVVVTREGVRDSDEHVIERRAIITLMPIFTVSIIEKRKMKDTSTFTSTLVIIERKVVVIKDGSTSTAAIIERKVVTKDASTSTDAVLVLARVFHVTSYLA
jgi:hypothetical protein